MIGVRVVQAYRFALDLSPAQERAVVMSAGAGRFAYNVMLARVMADPRCVWRATVDRLFQRRIRPAEESGLRAHLPDCPPCRRRGSPG